MATYTSAELNAACAKIEAYVKKLRALRPAGYSAGITAQSLLNIVAAMKQAGRNEEVGLLGIRLSQIL